MKNHRHVRHWLRGLLLFWGIAMGAAGWAALAPLSMDSRELVYVIPKGTWARRMAGEKIEVLPSEIRLTLGVRDILILKNEDDVPQMFGPVLIMPGQTFQLPFRSASRVQFACTLHASGQLAIIVEPTPGAGWERLRWRLVSAVEIRAQRG